MSSRKPFHLERLDSGRRAWALDRAIELPSASRSEFIPETNEDRRLVQLKRLVDNLDCVNDSLTCEYLNIQRRQLRYLIAAGDLKRAPKRGQVVSESIRGYLRSEKPRKAFLSRERKAAVELGKCADLVQDWNGEPLLPSPMHGAPQAGSGSSPLNPDAGRKEKQMEQITTVEGLGEKYERIGGEIRTAARAFRDSLEKLFELQEAELIDPRYLHIVLFSPEDATDGRTRLPTERTCAQIAMLNGAIGWIRSDLKAEIDRVEARKAAGKNGDNAAA